MSDHSDGYCAVGCFGSGCFVLFTCIAFWIAVALFAFGCSSSSPRVGEVYITEDSCHLLLVTSVVNLVDAKPAPPRKLCMLSEYIHVGGDTVEYVGPTALPWDRLRQYRRLDLGEQTFGERFTGVVEEVRL